FCAEAHEKLSALRKELDQNLLLAFRHFPLAELHEFALLAAISAEAAGQQGNFWEMHDLLFENQEIFQPNVFMEFAEILELDLHQFEHDVKRKDIEERIRADFMGGVRSGVNGTPGFFLNGEKFEGDLSSLRELMLAA